ncbi:MAG: hypothetical protein AABN95_07240 [Acidobacteriota bacterium]
MPTKKPKNVRPSRSKSKKEEPLPFSYHLTRLTNAFSKKWDNLHAALSLYFAYYNFCRIHSSIRCTPAMESGLTGHVWTLRELLAA